MTVGEDLRAVGLDDIADATIYAGMTLAAAGAAYIGGVAYASRQIVGTVQPPWWAEPALLVALMCIVAGLGVQIYDEEVASDE